MPKNNIQLSPEEEMNNTIIFLEFSGDVCTATEMIPTTEMIPAVTTEMIPGISGMELRGLQKLDNNLERAFYLFILHLFYGV